ncbi:hypothetical protein DFH28DRAFT_363710 [Melampsora americana]|nr:hypothetical protein DFH28DRAFT_363710 [Melampsora americana]
MYAFFYLLAAKILSSSVISVRSPGRTLLKGDLSQGTYQERCLGQNNNMNLVNHYNDNTQVLDNALHSQHEVYLRSVQEHLMDDTDFSRFDGADNCPEAQTLFNLFSQEIRISDHEGTKRLAGLLGGRIFSLPENYPSTSGQSASVPMPPTQGQGNTFTDPDHTGHSRKMGLESILNIPESRFHAYDATSTSNFQSPSAVHNTNLIRDSPLIKTSRSKRDDNGCKRAIQIQKNIKLFDKLSFQDKLHLLSTNSDWGHSKYRISPSIFLFLKTIGSNILQNEVSLFTQVERFFEDLHSVISNDIYGNLCSDLSYQKAELKNTLDNAICMAAKKITPVFMAILWIMHEKQIFNEAWEHVYEDAWKFLKVHFSGWEDLFKDKETLRLSLRNYKYKKMDWYNAEDVLLFFANNSQKSRVPMKPAWYLVDSWYQSFTRNQPFGLIKKNRTDLNMIERIHQNQLKYFRQSLIDHSRESFNQNQNKRRPEPLLESPQHQQRICLSSSYNLVQYTSGHTPLKPIEPHPVYSHRFSRFLVKIGNEEITKHTDLFHKIDEYFQLLEGIMLQSFDSAKAIFLKNPTSVSGIPFINNGMVRKAIGTFKLQFMPAILAALILTHQEQKSFHSLDLLISSGWTSLRKYLTQWETLFSNHPSAIFISKRESERKSSKIAVDCSKTQHVFQYMTTHQVSDDIPLYLIFHFTDQWYTSVTNEDVDIGFKLFQPSFDQLKRIHRYYCDKSQTQESRPGIQVSSKK